MAEESVRCALWLKEQGLKNEDIVLTCTSNQISTYIPILATLYNGASHIFASTGIQLRTYKIAQRIPHQMYRKWPYDKKF